VSQRPGSEGSSVSDRRPVEQLSSWPERIRHHGSRVLLLVTLAVLITVLFPPTEGLNIDVPSEGAVALETVTADIAFSVPKTLAELARERRLAMETVPVPSHSRRLRSEPLATLL
jgi:hypothetical protein